MALIAKKFYKFRVDFGDKVLTFTGKFIEEDDETVTFIGRDGTQIFNKSRLIYYEEQKYE